MQTCELIGMSVAISAILVIGVLQPRDRPSGYGAQRSRESTSTPGSPSARAADVDPIIGNAERNPPSESTRHAAPPASVAGAVPAVRAPLFGPCLRRFARWRRDVGGRGALRAGLVSRPRTVFHAEAGYERPHDARGVAPSTRRLTGAHAAGTVTPAVAVEGQQDWRAALARAIEEA